MLYFAALWLLLSTFSHLLVSALYPLRIRHDLTAHHETTANKWHCYRDEFAPAFPYHSLQAPCLRFISSSLGAVTMSGGMGIHPFGIQVDAGEMSAGNIELRWTLIVPPIRKGGKEETYPVQECRNKMSCDVYVSSNAYHHGDPVVMVIGSYQSTPWIKTTLRVSLKKQGEGEAPIVLPRQLLEHQATQRQKSQQSSHKVPHESRQNESRPSDSHYSAQLVPQETPVAQVSRVRRVRRGRNNPAPPDEVRTSSTLPGRGGRQLKGRISSSNWRPEGDNTFQPQYPSRRERRGRPNRKMTAVSKNTRRIGRNHLALSRPGRSLPLSPRQSSRQFSKRRDSRQANRATAYGHQSPRRQSHGVVRQHAVPGTRQGYGQQTSTDVRSQQTSLQPLQSWQRPSEQTISPYSRQGHSTNPSQYPIPHIPPSVIDNYQQRIQSEVNALQRLQTSWHRQEEYHQQRQEQKKSQRRGVHKGSLLAELQDFRADHLRRLNRYSLGKSHPGGSSSPAPGKKRLTETARKPSRIIPNYYPIIPHKQVEQERGTTAPTATKTMVPTKMTTTTTNATTETSPTTTASPPFGGRPMTNRERMRNDRLVYQGLWDKYQQEALRNGPNATNPARRHSSAYERVPSTYREGGQIPVGSEFRMSPFERGLSTLKGNEGFSDYTPGGIHEWADDGEPVSSENFPETSQYEESQVRLSEGATDNRSQFRMVPSDEPQRKTAGRANSRGAVDRSNSRESWAEYSDLLPAYYDEDEDSMEENTFNNEDGADEIYDNSVSMDTWGESKSVHSKRDRSIADEINRGLPKEDYPMTKQLIADNYMHELDMPLNEETFRALQEEIINEERKQPKSREDNIPPNSAESFDFRSNARQQGQYFASPNSDNELLRRSSALASVIGKRVAPVRAARTVAQYSAFETSASEPREYSYNPSSDLSQLDTVTRDAVGDTDGRSLDEETFRALREKILEEERVGLSQRTNGGYLSDGLPSDEIRKGPLRHNDHIRRITVTDRSDLSSPNNRKGSEWQKNVYVNRQDSLKEDIGPVDNNDVDMDRPSAMEPELTPSSVGTKKTRGDYFGYDPVSEEDRVPERIESEQWSEWSHCSHSCGHGTKTRHRACTEPNTSTCSSGVESHVVKCALQRCSEDWEGVAAGVEESVSEWRDWSGWSACSVSCGSGLSHRKRTCLQDEDQDLACLEQREETRTCWIDYCSNERNGAMSEGGTTRRSDHHHGHHTKRIKCHLDESRSHLPMELFWTSPTGEKITHAMTHEKNSKYHIEGTTLVVSEDEPTEGSYHCIAIYGGSSGSNNMEKAGPTGACRSNPCHHKGICLDQPGPHNVSYRCLCPAGYEGMTCHMAPYLKGDVIVWSLLGWFIVSSSVIILVICLCCSKQMKKRKMKQKLELDDAPAEKLLAKILPHIETLNNADSTVDEDIKPLLGFRPPKVASKPPLKDARPTEPMEMPKQTGTARFKNIVKKITKTNEKKVEGFAFPTPKQMKTLNEEFKSQRNQNNSNTFDSSKSEDGSLSSDTTLNSTCESSCESLPKGVDDEGFSLLANHNMNNCSWDYSNVSSCMPCDLNTSSIVGNDDDSLLEISTEDFRDFQVASAFSVFKGSPSTQRNRAVIDPSLGDGDSSSILTACSTSLPGEVPHSSEKHPMFHFEPTSSNSMCAENSFSEQQNHCGNGCGPVSGSSPWRNERSWLMRTPPRRGNGVRVRLPPSPLLSVSPSRLRLPPSPTRQRASRMFVPAEEHAILEQYRERRKTHPKHATSHVTFETRRQEALDDHPVLGDCHGNGPTSKRPSISSSHGASGSFGPCYRDNGRSTSVATESDYSQDPTPTGIATVEKPSRQRLEANRSLFRQRVCESSGRFGDLTMPARQDIHQPFSLDKSCTTSSDCVSVANQGPATTNVMAFGFPEYTNTMNSLFMSHNTNNNKNR